MSGWDTTSLVIGGCVGAVAMFLLLFLLAYCQELADRSELPKPKPRRTAGDIVREKEGK